METKQYVTVHPKLYTFTLETVEYLLATQDHTSEQFGTKW